VEEPGPHVAQPPFLARARNRALGRFARPSAAGERAPGWLNRNGWWLVGIFWTGVTLWQVLAHR
jgi:hypothetical protein